MVQDEKCPMDTQELFQWWLSFVRSSRYWSTVRAITMEVYESQVGALLKHWIDAELPYKSTKSRSSKTRWLVQMCDATATEQKQAKGIASKVWEEWNAFIQFWFERGLVWTDFEQHETELTVTDHVIM